MISETEILKAPPSEELDQLIAWRREFHSYPEIRWTEFWTSTRIVEILKDLGFEVLYGKKLYDLLMDSEPSVLQLRKYVPDEDVMNDAYSKAIERLEGESRIAPMQGGLTGVVAWIEGKKVYDGKVMVLGGGRGENDGKGAGEGAGGDGASGGDAGGKGEVTKEEDGEEGNGARKNPSTFGFRVDIDGLPLMESAGSDHSPTDAGFSSSNGNMHACGHDGHIAIGLGLAKMISENIDELYGKYYLLFQPGEEGGMGGEVFSHLPFMKEIDHFATVHLGLMGGRKLSCGLSFMDANAHSVEFLGRSTHSAVAPNEGRNALLAACTAVTQLYAIPRHGEGASRVNVGEFHSDNAMNIISDKTTFTYQTRGESPEIADHMDQQAKRILRSAAQMFDVEVTIREEGKYISAPNDPILRKAVKDAGIKLGIHEQAILDEFRLPGSEDAPYLMKKVQENGGEAVFIGLGCDTRGGHHNPLFELDEDLLHWGVHILWELILNRS